MRINIYDIPEDGLHQDLDIPVSINDRTKPDRASVRITLLRFGKKILVHGSVNVTVSLPCSRCLNDFLCPVDLDFREEYTPLDDTGLKGDQELSDDELGTGFYEGEEINMVEIIREQVLLAVPMKPLCKEECKGICSKCGTDLNEHSCNCEDDRIDLRLAPLAKYKASLNQRKE